MAERRVVPSPGHGAIEVPPDWTPEETARRKAEGERVIEALKRRRLYPPGTISTCLRCRRRTVNGKDDMVYRLVRPGAVLVFANIRGGECMECGFQAPENADQFVIDEVAGDWEPPEFEARLSEYGKGALGTYWPKDVVRNMGVRAGMRALVQILDRRTLIVRFEEEPVSSSGRRKRAAHAR
jgi:hypothetical protein